jgi:hypothetical protein
MLGAGLGEALSDGDTVKKIHSGLPAKERTAVKPPTEAELAAFTGEWASKSLWDLWAAGPIERYHIAHWGLTMPGVGALGRFLLRASLLHADAADKPTVCKGLADDAGDAALEAAAAAAFGAVVAATRTPKHGSELAAAIAPLLAALPTAQLQCSSLFEHPEWTADLVRFVRAPRLPPRPPPPPHAAARALACPRTCSRALSLAHLRRAPVTVVPWSRRSTRQPLRSRSRPSRGTAC